LDVERWYLAGRDKAFASFEAIKHREAKARARERADERKRKRSSRRKTHEAAVQQFVKTANGN
jgi:hypothetical protein